MSQTNLNILVASRATLHHGIGGLERHCHDLCNGLAARGHKITLVTSKHPDGLERLNEDGVEILFIPDSLPGKYNPNFYRGAERLIKELQQEKPFDVLISQSLALGPYVHRTPRNQRPPCMLICHGTFWMEVLSSSATVKNLFIRHYRMLRHSMVKLDFEWSTPGIKMQWQGWRSADMVVAVGPYVAQCLRTQYLIPKKRLRIIPNGVDLNDYSPNPDVRQKTRNELGFNEKFVILCPGRLSQDKSFDMAIKVLPALASKYPDLRMLIVGDGPESDNLKNLASELGVTGSVLFTGRIPQSDMGRFYAASDALFIPSERYEGLPYTLVEGAARGLAIITTSRGGQGAEIEDGVNGLLYRPGNLKDCIKAFERLLGDKAFAKRLASNARSFAESRYDINLMIDSFEALAYELAGE